MKAGMPLPSREKETDPRLRSGPRTVRVLLAEDDEPMRLLLAQALEKRGYDVTQCEDGLCLAERVASFAYLQEEADYDVIVSDVRLPGATGLEVLNGLRQDSDPPPFVLITAFGDEATHEEARRLGAAAMLDKPFEIDELFGILRSLVDGNGVGRE